MRTRRGRKVELSKIEGRLAGASDAYLEEVAFTICEALAGNNPDLGEPDPDLKRELLRLRRLIGDEQEKHRIRRRLSAGPRLVIRPELREVAE